MSIVLNSLAREFTDASLRLLPHGGDFLEMGKTDIRDPAEIAKRNPGITYQPFDLLQEDPGAIAGMLDELTAMFGQHALRPLPVTAWDIRRAGEAIRHLSQARHVGKVVLTIPAPPNPDGTVLITGGTGPWAPW